MLNAKPGAEQIYQFIVNNLKESEDWHQSLINKSMENDTLLEDLTAIRGLPEGNDILQALFRKCPIPTKKFERSSKIQIVEALIGKGPQGECLLDELVSTKILSLSSTENEQVAKIKAKHALITSATNALGSLSLPLTFLASRELWHKFASGVARYCFGPDGRIDTRTIDVLMSVLADKSIFNSPPFVNIRVWSSFEHR